MPLEWEAVIANVVPVVVGVVIGFLLAPLSETWSNRRKRKRLAAVLACEVEAIRAMAAQSIYVNSPTVEDTRKTLNMVGPGPVPLTSVALDDIDYPTEVFKTSLGDVEILGEDMMLKLTELYRWIEYAHHAKRQNLRWHSEFMELAKGVSSRGGPTPAERDVMSNASVGSVVLGTQYLKNEARIVELATPVVTALERLGKTTVHGKVSVSTGELLTGSVGPKDSTKQ
jgi:hypothetical protein